MATLSGTCTLDGNAVEGAKVHVINADTDTHEGSVTSDVNGDWSLTVSDDTAQYACFAQLDDGSNQYNAEGRPFVEP